MGASGGGDFATVVLRVDGTQSVTDLDKFSVAAERAATAGTKAEQSAAGLSKSVGGVSPVTIAGTRDMGMWAAMQAEAASKMGEHSLAVGRLERNLASFIERAIGLNSTLGLVVTSLAKFGLGTIETAGALAVLAGGFAIYEKLTEDTRKATEEHKKLVVELEKEAKFATDVGQRTQTYNELIADQQKVLEKLAALRAAAPGALVFDPKNVFTLGYSVEGSKKEGDKLIAQATYLAGKLDEIGRAHAVASTELQAGQLATLISNQSATTEQRQNALTLYRTWVADFDKIDKNDLARRVEQIKNINLLMPPMDRYRAALVAEMQTSTAKLEVDRTALDQLVKLDLVRQHDNEIQAQALAIAKQRLATERELASGIPQGRLGVLGLDTNALNTKVNIDPNTDQGIAAALEAFTKLSEAKIKIATAFFEQQKGVEREALQQELDDTKKMLAEEDRIRKVALKEIQKSIASVFEDLFTKGANAWDAIWQTAKKGAFKLVADLLAADLMGGLKDQFQSVFSAIGLGGTSGGKASSGNVASQGAGAASIAAVAGPWAAATALFVAGANEWSAAAKRAKDGMTAFEATRTQLQASIAALTTSFTAAEQSAYNLSQTFKNTLFAELQAANKAISANSTNMSGATFIGYPGKGTIESDLARSIQALEAAQGKGKNVNQDRILAQTLADVKALAAQYDDVTKKAAELLALQQKQADDDLKVRDLRAKGDTDAADALALWNAQVKEFQAAVAQFGGGSDYVKHLSQTQDAERAKLAADQKAAADAAAKATADAAAAKALTDKQSAEDYRVRLLAAQGHAEEATAMQLALAQQREYEKAVKDGLSEATLAALKLAQAAETAANAAARAQAAEQALGDLQVRSLRATGQGSAADDLAFQLAQQKEREDAQKNQSADYYAKLLLVQQQESDARKAAAQAAVNSQTSAMYAGVPGGAASGGATSSTSQGPFNTNFATTVTAATGDRIADGIVALQAIARQQLGALLRIDNNTRDMIGGVDIGLAHRITFAAAREGSARI
jgi:hypothetical protein